MTVADTDVLIDDLRGQERVRGHLRVEEWS
jgi:hypothetical protein